MVRKRLLNCTILLQQAGRGEPRAKKSDEEFPGNPLHRRIKRTEPDFVDTTAEFLGVRNIELRILQLKQQSIVLLQRRAFMKSGGIFSQDQTSRTGENDLVFDAIKTDQLFSFVTTRTAKRCGLRPGV